MKYSFKTGRLKFEAVDTMICDIRTQKKKSKIKAPKLIIKRPVSDERTIDSLDKTLSKHILKFNKKNNRFKMIRRMSKSEVFKSVRKTSAYVAAMCVMFVLTFGTFGSMNITFAKQVIADGKPIGIVKDVNEFENNVANLETELNELSEGSFNDSAELVYVTRICFEEDVTPEEEIMQNVMATYDETSLAYALYVDGNMICAAKEESDINDVLEEYKSQFAIDIENSAVGFYEEIEIRNEYVPIAYLRSKAGILTDITKTRDEEVEYTVQDNDTVWDIANAYGLTVDEISQLNPQMSDFIKAGDVIKITESEPVLQVKVTYTETVNQTIPYENDIIEDSSMTKGTKQVVEEGIDGEKEVTREIVLVNGKQTDINIVEEKVISEPVNGKVKIGTKIVTGIGSGSFIRPASGTITARFGSRSSRWSSGRHTGMDFATGYGNPIYASDSGKVSYAGYQGSYGNLVIINHGNGYETYYGHCSKLLVKPGQVVEKGDLIARVGSTGNSTGNHCHFEIRYNGTIKNPENYLR